VNHRPRHCIARRGASRKPARQCSPERRNCRICIARACPALFNSSLIGQARRAEPVARSNDKTVKVGRHSRRQIKAKSADNGDAVHGGSLSSKSRIVALVAAGAIAIAGSVAVFLAAGGLPMPERLRASDPRPAAFVGSEACADCHQAETALWKQSQHKHAMQHASAASVLGDFENARFDYFDVHSRFFKKDNKFFVETDGPDGKLATFEIKYTFGISPLQQYLVEFPDGRIQALSTAWDSRPKDQGGQHWFHLYPNEEI
jgi:hypothetical protein